MQRESFHNNVHYWFDTNTDDYCSSLFATEKLKFQRRTLDLGMNKYYIMDMTGSLKNIDGQMNETGGMYNYQACEGQLYCQ